jgi:hypothetical protein
MKVHASKLYGTQFHVIFRDDRDLQDSTLPPEVCRMTKDKVLCLDNLEREQIEDVWMNIGDINHTGLHTRKVD